MDFKKVNTYTLKKKYIFSEHDFCVLDVPCLQTYCNSKLFALKKSSYCKGFITLKNITLISTAYKALLLQQDCHLHIRYILNEARVDTDKDNVYTEVKLR